MYRISVSFDRPKNILHHCYSISYWVTFFFLQVCKVLDSNAVILNEETWYLARPPGDPWIVFIPRLGYQCCLISFKTMFLFWIAVFSQNNVSVTLRKDLLLWLRTPKARWVSCIEKLAREAILVKRWLFKAKCTFQKRRFGVELFEGHTKNWTQLLFSF